MANGHGGARTPASPAPVSGPGANSARTDGGPGSTKTQALSAPTGMDYGDHKMMIDQERTAPLPKASMPNAPTGNAVAQAASTTPPYTGGDFGAPSNRPGEPVTSGVALGAGPGPEALNLPGGQQAQPTGAMTQMLGQMSQTDTTGLLAQLYQAAKNFGV